ncbi:MAG: ATPase [Gammaproteobacteria bacterium RIFCSPHIGHO2_12_FULL_38_11]|nr:MAG: ATPase [Gammaproteobacteria bacterium RIFCSPHIGHO2_12_FULL_38_11]
MSKFIGRQTERNLLEDLLLKQTASLVVVYGRRRIGKSRLIEEFAKPYRFISFSGLFSEEKTTNQDQLDEFRRRFQKQLGVDPGALSDWSDAFHRLAEQTRTGRVIILLDEITWMGEQDANFLGKLKNAWDMEFKKNDQLILSLCGSVSLWIEKNLISNRGFYGRISLKLRLRELSLSDCNRFLEGRGGIVSDYEKFKILSVTGGIPKYLEEIRLDQSADENIKRLCFSRYGQLYSDYDYIFLSLLARNSPCYQNIIQALSQNALKREEILKKINFEDSGLLSQYLEELTSSGFLQRDYTWHLKSEKMSKLSKYRLSDNYLRFYSRYIQPNIAKIENDRYENHSMTALPGWPVIMGLQVENLVLNNRQKINGLIGVYPDEIINDGPFFQNKTARQKGCQIDYLIQTRFGVLYLCEIKFAFKGIRSNVITEVQEKIERLSLPKNFSIKPILIHVGDVYDEVLTSNYFSKIIDMSLLLHSS